LALTLWPWPGVFELGVGFVVIVLCLGLAVSGFGLVTSGILNIPDDFWLSARPSLRPIRLFVQTDFVTKISHERLEQFG